MQAILHASQDEDEFIKEYLITYEKVICGPFFPPSTDLKAYTFY